MLINSNVVDFFQTGHAVFDLLQACTAQIPYAVFRRLIVDIECAAALHDDAPDLLRDRHDLVKSHAAFVAIGALTATNGTVNSDARVDVILLKTLFLEGFS